MTAPARDHAAEIEAALAVVTGDAPGPLRLVPHGAPASLSSALPPALPRVLPQWQRKTGSRWPGPDGSLGGVWAVGDDLVVGLGPRPAGPRAVAPASEAWLRAGEAAGARLDRDALLDLSGTGAGTGTVTDDDAAALCCGLAVGAAAATRDAAQGPPLDLHVDAALAAAGQRGLRDAAAVHLARLLTGAPANLATPARIAGWAAAAAAAVGASCEVLDAQGLADGGYGGVLAIGAGSANPPHLVRVRWTGGGPTPDLAVVGKGVTFDSGGLSLKSPAAMQDMRSDKAGAAAALAVVLSLAAARAPVTVEALLPLAENLPGPTATRPGDVITSRSGRLVQVMDTDFEGRVLMADALSDAAASSPRLLVDVATLTYQAVVALGHEVGALLACDDDAADAVLAAAERAGEPLWRLPWADRYAGQVELGWAVRNHPLHDSGRAITAALFLAAFVPDGQPWVHLDVAGPSWRGDPSSDGATGFGVRTLLQLARGLV